MRSNRVVVDGVNRQKRVVVNTGYEAIAVFAAVVVNPGSAADFFGLRSPWFGTVGPRWAMGGSTKSGIDRVVAHLVLGETVLQMHERREDLKLGGIFAGVVIPANAEQLAAIKCALTRLWEMVEGRAIEVRRQFDGHGGIALVEGKGHPVGGVGVDFPLGWLEHCAAGERNKTENKPEARKRGRGFGANRIEMPGRSSAFNCCADS